jgi:hypothetical protein
MGILIGVARLMIRLMIFLFVAILAACATYQKTATHGFQFDAKTDSPGYEILEYRYGISTGSHLSSGNAIRQFGRSNQSTSIYGDMPVGDSLYVRWKNIKTGTIFEKKVILSGVLPKDMEKTKLYFVVGEKDVYIYLLDEKNISNANKNPEGPSFFKYSTGTAVRIYP